MNNTHPFFIKALTKSVRVIAPSLAKKLANKILFSPKRVKGKWPSHVKKFSISTRYGDIASYRYGEGKCIWLIHGWSGSAFDFWPLMQQLAEIGYSTITFDFPSHGHSSGKSSSLPQMIKAFDEISQSMLEPNMVITHAMGASIVANSKWLKSYRNDLLLISPILDTYKLLQRLVQRSGFDSLLFEQAIRDLYKKERMYLPDLHAISALNSFKGQLKVIHDQQDKLAPVAMSEQLSQSAGVTLITTKKLGHNKILRSKRVMILIESFDVSSFDNMASMHRVGS